jgi:hypothetical protein
MTIFHSEPGAAEDDVMETGSRQSHWQGVYTTKGEDEVSWFQENPAPSLALIAEIGAVPSSAIIDIGGGASRLVDHLIEDGFQDLTVLDLSAAALQAAKANAPRGRIGWLPTPPFGSRPAPMTSGMTGQRSTFSPTRPTARPMSRGSSKA